MREIPLSVPNLNIEIAENLRECVETGWVSTGGRFIAEFEKKIARYVGVSEAVGCQSGTAGLHTALRILGVGPGDAVLAPTLTFIAAVNPVRYLYAEPIFIDCDDSLCMDAEKLAKFCDEECDFTEGVLKDKSTGKTIKAIIPVHIFGNLANMEPIMDVANKYRLKVLEDATEALGSFWEKGKYAGKHAGTVGDMGVFSFNANKIITTGGGGMIISENAEYLNRAQYLTTTAKDDGLYFVHNEVGYNYRMLNLQAALGVSQIDELPEFINTKIENYKLYKELLSGIEGIRLLPFDAGIKSNHWFYSLIVDNLDGNQELSRDYLLNSLIENNIQCRPVWRLVHKQKAYQGYRNYKIEKAEYYEKHILNLPCSTNLSKDDVKYVCEAVRNIGGGGY
jgi:aminotransferase in exopolysaccharide biosynthesis